ncbi:aldehyde dehydrogenase family protein [Falsirhodobacter xinxiangensis]|uniref:aldehyde dehydrogenase family protein n=1 Tax=Falsirhodobacter xinxiangensis TaxID=2530049 RepID=UPI0010AA56E4|nr:aldehyde dehydrogenase family protein [Rhodobacter xinxiangensis]
MVVLSSWIDGGPVAATEAEPAFKLIDPSSGALIARLDEGGGAATDRAVVAAEAAFRANRRSSLHDRAGWLRAAAAALRAASDDIAALICADVGKPLKAARFEAGRGGDFLDNCAAATLQLTGETIPVDAAPAGRGHFGFTRHVPYGVVAAITPFNAPLNLLLQKVAPALAAGNAVIVKPAPSGTRTALRVVAEMEAAGVPKGLVGVLTGDRDTALALAAHPGVSAVSFTGGTVAGDALARAASARKFTAELGSNAANVVFADADIATAAKKIAGAAFEASGQQCISAQRVLVQRPVFDAFLAAFVATAQGMKTGDPLDITTDLGPMVHRAAADRVMAMAADAAAAGARVPLAPEQRDCFVTPGVFADVPRNARLWTEEVFGPLALVNPFDTLDEALELANDSPFGLQGAVFTASLATAMRFSDDFEVGSLWVNEPSRFRLDMAPFGGVKRSGVGREGIRYAIEEMSQIRFTGIMI